MIVAGCLVGAVFGISKLKINGSPDSAPVTNGALPPAVSTAPQSPSPTPAHPFEDTPAASWADGALGIVIPAAHPAGSYSAAQVAAAYRRTKKMLIAADLNKTTLRGGSPDAFANMLIAQQRTSFIHHLDETGHTVNGFQKSSRTWVASFAPHTTQFVGTVIKVHGTMHAVTGREGTFHVLRVHTDYIFAYAVDQPGRPSTLTRIVLRDVVDVDFGAYTDPGGPLEPFWRPEGGGASGARCDVQDGFIHPQFPDGSPDKVKPTGKRIHPYDQSTPPPKTGKCLATTGT